MGEPYGRTVYPGPSLGKNPDLVDSAAGQTSVSQPRSTIAIFHCCCVDKASFDDRQTREKMSGPPRKSSFQPNAWDPTLQMTMFFPLRKRQASPMLRGLSAACSP